MVATNNIRFLTRHKRFPIIVAVTYQSEQVEPETSQDFKFSFKVLIKSLDLIPLVLPEESHQVCKLMEIMHRVLL